MGIRQHTNARGGWAYGVKWRKGTLDPRAVNKQTQQARCTLQVGTTQKLCSRTGQWRVRTTHGDLRVRRVPACNVRSTWCTYAWYHVWARTPPPPPP